ncbi:hypothetical protein PACTADRAFT_81373 [Pachysolen tannophilus NRRL Y-2460]|uniref:RING-type domain-containing protein n=1 Tax=Pachysolen tannophilus NRRL Y-2460 TaxID=669874 RepID=A0A1E4TST4_PACTA|nr:hypothetical protein PACTADRAFT_81373 [Pachysolen tannophilus NRRL Y-2460]
MMSNVNSDVFDKHGPINAVTRPLRPEVDSRSGGKIEVPIKAGNDEDEDQISDAEDSDDALIEELDKIGRSINFSLPNLPPFPNFKLFNKANVEQTNTNGTPDDSFDQQLSQIFNDRREQLTNFIYDLTSGFSIQAAMDRLQPFRDVINESVELPVDDFEEEYSKKEETEPHGVVPVIQKQHPIIDQFVLPQDPGKGKTRKLKHAKSFRDYEYLTNLKSEEFFDKKLLRSRITKIISIKDISEPGRNKLVQQLMMRSYYEKLKKNKPNSEELRNFERNMKINDDSWINQDSNENIAEDGEEENEENEEEDEEEEEDDDDEVILTANDTKPSYYSEEENILGCQHYQRNCKIECPICAKWFPCRFCHDAVITSHQLPRNQIKHVLCMFCFTPQNPSQVCCNESCQENLSQYYCDKCKLFDNDPNKDIYHCDDCGICRLGLGLNEDFFHCHGCNACISIDLLDDHKCIENSTRSNCSICEEYMFNSIKTVVFMSCGHPIHQSCYDEFTKHSYKCPICSKTITNMEAQFRVLDQEISFQPLPEPYGSWRVIIQCNDCNAKNIVKYHVLGLKCENCKSYNTAQLKLLKEPKEDFDLAESDEQCSETATLNPENNPLSGENNSSCPQAQEVEDDDETLGNLINNDTLNTFEQYRDWFFATMETYRNQNDTNTSSTPAVGSSIQERKEKK